MATGCHSLSMAATMNPTTTTDTIVVRRAVRADDADLARLAALDSALPLNGPIVLAESDGVPLAALDLDAGRVVADPFTATSAHVALLRTHACSLRVRRPRARRRRLRGAIPA